jgi:plasmid stability protein
MVTRMIELITQIDEQTYRELERRAQRRQRSVSEEVAEILRQALGTDRDALLKHLQSLHTSLKSRSFTPSPELIREDRECR